MRHGELPDGLTYVRSTDRFTNDSVPRGLLRAHRVGSNTWGLLRVTNGSLRFVWEDADAAESTSGEAHIDVAAGSEVVIPPGRPHRVEPGTDVEFLVEFHAGSHPSGA